MPYQGDHRNLPPLYACGPLDTEIVTLLEGDTPLIPVTRVLRELLASTPRCM